MAPIDAYVAQCSSGDPVSTITAATADGGVYHFGELLDLDATQKVAPDTHSAPRTLVTVIDEGH